MSSPTAPAPVGTRRRSASSARRATPLPSRSRLSISASTSPRTSRWTVSRWSPPWRRRAGPPCTDYVTCQLDGELAPAAQRVRLNLEPGQSRVVTFRLNAPPRGNAPADAPYQASAQLTARLVTSDNRPFVDNLAFNNTACA